MKDLGRITVKYYTNDKYLLISKSNLDIYNAYLKANSVVNADTFETSYSLYQRNFFYFLVFLAENYNNIGLYSNDFLDNAPDIVLNYMHFCRQSLQNNKKTINNKVNAIASFYKWSTKTGKIKNNPLADKITRMSRADEEKIISDHFLTEGQIGQISNYLLNNYDEKFDFQDALIWFIFLDSANRLGAVSKITLSSLNEERRVFENIREKEARVVDIAFSKQTLELIRWWIEQRRYDYDLLNIDALFITKNRGRWNQMCTRTIQRRVQKIGTIIGIDDLHPHSIRKSSASRMLDFGVDSYLISQYLNHKSMEVLKNYIKPKSSADLRKQIEKQMNEN